MGPARPRSMPDPSPAPSLSRGCISIVSGRDVETPTVALAASTFVRLARRSEVSQTGHVIQSRTDPPAPFRDGRSPHAISPGTTHHRHIVSWHDRRASPLDLRLARWRAAPAGRRPSIHVRPTPEIRARVASTRYQVTIAFHEGDPVVGVFAGVRTSVSPVRLSPGSGRLPTRARDQIYHLQLRLWKAVPRRASR